jgi:flagellar biosynthesis GTPase FlhF
MKKGLIAALAIGTLMAVGVLSIGQVRAEEVQPQPIWQRIAERFGLNKDEVQTVFEESRGQRGEQAQVRQEERLNQAVSEGVLSEDQKQALQTKHEEMRQEREVNREAHKTEMDQWFSDNGIDHQAMMEHIGGPGPRQGGGRGFRNK